MPYPVLNLIEGRNEPISVRPSDPAQKALRLMIEHDFGQLPVVDKDRIALGMITHESILRALNNFGVMLDELRVSNAIVKAQTYRPEDDLFDLLDRLKETNAVLIVDGDEGLMGIVTSYDSTEYFRRRAEDMMLVEDIETMIKDLILAAFTNETDESVVQENLQLAIDEVTSSTKALLGRYRNALRHYLKLEGHEHSHPDSQNLEASFSHLAPRDKPKAFEDLTLYEYTELLLHKDRWTRYAPFFDLEPTALRNLLTGVRETRNCVAHFRREITATERDQLRFCADWLAQHPAELLIEQQAGIPVDWPVPSAKNDRQTAVVQEARVDYSEAHQSRDETIVPVEEDLSPRDSRYAPLAIWLQSKSAKESRTQLRFEQIEEIIGGSLPPSARTHRAWWANDSVGHVQSQQWLDVGWRVAQINMTEEKVTFARIREREAAYIDFFSKLLDKAHSTTQLPLKDLWPDGRSWHTAFSLPEEGAKVAHFVFAFARGKRFRVELYIDTGEQEANKAIFDRIYAQRDAIHAALGAQVDWERLSEKRASRIAWYRPGENVITDDEESLQEVRDWAVEAMVLFYGALAEPVGNALAAYV